jgi:iron complex outermembrane receptor protein
VVPTGMGGNQIVYRDLAGYTLIRSPTWSGNVTARYAKETDAGRFDVTGTLYYSSRVYHDLADRVSQSPYELINASVGWKAPNSGFEVRAWGKNLTNRAVISGGTISASYDGVAYAPPRTYGAEVIYRF